MFWLCSKVKYCVWNSWAKATVPVIGIFAAVLSSWLTSSQPLETSKNQTWDNKKVFQGCIFETDLCLFAFFKLPFLLFSLPPHLHFFGQLIFFVWNSTIPERKSIPNLSYLYVAFMQNNLAWHPSNLGWA